MIDKSQPDHLKTITIALFGIAASIFVGICLTALGWLVITGHLPHWSPARPLGASGIAFILGGATGAVWLIREDA